jgi:hypothetical protein
MSHFYAPPHVANKWAVRRPSTKLWVAAALVVATMCVQPPEVAAIHNDLAPAAGPYAAASTMVAFDWSTFRRHAAGSDNWPTTWAANGAIYSAWGDGSGVGPSYDPKYRVSMGLASISGNSAGSLTPRNLVGGRNPSLARCLPNIGVRVDLNPSGPCYRRGLSGKTWGLLALNDFLYAWISPGSWTNHYEEQRLFRSQIGTNNWVAADWAFKPSDAYPLLNPTFMQAGRNAAGRGAYIYAYAPRLAPTDRSSLSIQKRNGVGEIALLRLRKTANPLNKANWQYFAGPSATGGARWTSNIAGARPVISDTNGVGWNVSATYLKARDRVYVAYEHTKSHAGYLSILEAPAPHGPWTTVYYGRFSNSAKGVPATAFYYSFLPNGFSGDRFTMLFTGALANDSLNVIDGRFVAR